LLKDARMSWVIPYPAQYVVRVAARWLKSSVLPSVLMVVLLVVLVLFKMESVLSAVRLNG
jgi:hypothetical protein